MNTHIYDPLVQQAMKDIQNAYRNNSSKKISVNGIEKIIPYPYPSPVDWRDNWIYFLMIDRFNNPDAPPASLSANPPSGWDRQYEFRQGGNFKGIEQQLDYVASLGAGAIWISPVLKNPKPNEKYNYHGYATQDFLSLDERFASDGTLATAEKEFIELVEAAHARGLNVIVDIVINHSARVFDYILNDTLQIDFTDANIMNAPLGTEPSIEWLDGSGQQRPDWINTLPPSSQLSPDDAVWPSDLQEHKDFFRRRGSKISDTVGAEGFVKGDFGALRQLVAEYLSISTTPQSIREQYGKFPVLNILIEAYVYLIAKFDIDGFRMDTVKYVSPVIVEIFGNAMREFALGIGKRNFFTFGEIYDDEQTINNFVGRNTSSTEGFGIDAALDFPLFYKLPGIAKSNIDVDELRKVFKNRKDTEKNILSSHGEAGRYFVSFLDNHDQKERFNHPLTPKEQVLLGLAVLFCLQGIPALYYGTEQGLNGTKDQAGNIRVGDNLEAVREALWGKTPVAFDQQNSFYQNIRQFGVLRNNEPALKYGRLYFREVSGNGTDFGFSTGLGGVVSFSRVLFDREIVIIANTNNTNAFNGFVILDLDINRAKPDMKVVYSNIDTVGEGTVQITDVTIYGDNITSSEAAILPVKLAPMEVQILTRK